MVGQVIGILVFLVCLNKRDVFRAGILSLYIAGLVANILLVKIGWLEELPFTLESVWVIYCLIMTVLLIPRDRVLLSLATGALEIKKVRHFLFLLTGLAAAATIYFLGNARNAFVDDLGLRRIENTLTKLEVPFYEPYLAAFSFFFCGAIFLFWVFKAHDVYPLARAGLLFASLSYPLWIIGSYGRDGILAFVYFHLISFLFVRRHFGVRLRMNFLVALPVLLLGMLFFEITNSRVAADGVYGGAMLSMLDYIGQQYTNVHVYTANPISHYYGQFNFNYVCSFFGLDGDSVVQSAREELAKASGRPFWYFGYALKELWIDFGFWGTAMILSVLAMVNSFVSGMVSFTWKWTYFQLAILFTFFGVFYNKFYFPGAQAYVLLIIVLAVIRPTLTKAFWI